MLFGLFGNIETSYYGSDTDLEKSDIKNDTLE